jgi:Glycosyl transferases group 1
MIKIFYTETILPRLCFIPFFVSRIILSIISVLYWKTNSRRPKGGESHLCIEAGIKGWDSIEFKEAFQSACEYMSPQNVHRLVLQPNQSYLKQIDEVLRQKPITHYLYDPRSNNSEVVFWGAVMRSFKVAMLLEKHGVVPIVALTDISRRAWRTQAAVVSARRGVVYTFISPRIIGPIFPHERLIGPFLMPFSTQTLRMLNSLIEKRPINRPPTARFTGSLYEPRTSMLEHIRAGLAVRGLDFEIKKKGGPSDTLRSSDLEYWSSMCNADIVVTTVAQCYGKDKDWERESQLTYRVLEVLASGSLLVVQDMPGIRRYFVPGIHCITFNSAEGAIDEIAYYLGNEAARLKIARKGKERADDLINSRVFWAQIDAMLGENSIF